jgi:hypothetical protein
MGDFFKGWRRKAGCVTLLMVCMFAAGWLRSFFVTDLILFPTANSLHSWISDRRGIAWTVETHTAEEHRSLMYDLQVPFVISPRFFQSDPTEWNLKLSFCGFRCFTGTALKRFTGTPLALPETSDFLPYWSIVIPLAVMSAYLLLSKSRKAKPVPANPAESA